MTRIRLAILATLALCASALAAQQAPGPGDLAPRTGTIAYMISDRPDALYRLFGRDSKGGWKLRSFAESMMRKQHEQDLDSKRPSATRPSSITSSAATRPCSAWKSR